MICRERAGWPNAQAQRRFRDSAQFGDGDERSQAPEIHILAYLQIA